MDIRMARAGAVVFMDMSRLTCLRGIFKRRLLHTNRSRPDMAPRCPEKLDWQFVRYVWNYRRTRRPKILEKLESLPNEKQAVVLQSRREAEEFLRSVEENAASG